MTRVRLFKNTSKNINEAATNELANQIAVLQTKMLAIDKRVNQQVQNLQKQATQQKQQIQQQIIQLQAQITAQSGVSSAGNDSANTNNQNGAANAQNANAGAGANTNTQK